LGARLADWLLGNNSATGDNRIPESLVAFVQVVADEPKFRDWFLALEGAPPFLRDEQFKRMAEALRADDADSEVADALDHISRPQIFNAVCALLKSA
jgi:hypothetical protein